jgi:hypothetical protein
MSPASDGPAVTDPSAYTLDFDAIAKLFADQSKAALKQGEEIFAVARKQLLNNIKNAEEFALQTVAKVRELTPASMPSIPAWVPTTVFSETVAAGFDVAEHVLAAERKVASSLLESVKVAS